MTPVGDLGIALKADVDDYQKSMATASDITGSLTGIVRGLGSAMRGMGLAITAASGIAAGAMFSLSRSAAKVNEAFREVDTITTSTKKSQEEYAGVVEKLNTQMGLNANKIEVINGLYKSLSAGIKEGEQAQEAFLTSAARLSVVGRTDLTTTVDVLSTAMNAYGRENMSAKRASDSLFATVQFGKTTLEELAPVMGRVIALASDMSVSIEELGASMAVLTRTGFSSRIAATGLRAALRSLMRPSEEMKGILRDIALDQNLFSNAMDKGQEEAKRIAQEYRNVSESLDEMAQAQREAREAVEKNSLKIQRTRLAIQAIEEDRIDQLDDVKTAELARSNSIEELQSKIEDYRFEVNEARLQETEARQTKEDLKNEIKDLQSEFKEQLKGVGDLQGGVGQLVVEEEGLIQTLTEVKKRADEQGVSISDLVPRARGLQAVLALVGDGGEELNEIFAAMKDDGLSDKEFEDLNERFGTTREEIQDLRDGVDDVKDQFEGTKGAVQDQRDAISSLKSAATDLGQVFNEEVNEALLNISDAITSVVDKIDSLEQSVKENISTFSVLAASIGLVLGPILFFGGQLAIIASAMGSMFIPLALTLGSVLGVIGLGLLRAAEGGNEASSMFETMRGVLSGLMGFLGRLRRIFVEEVLPGMITAGQGIINVFSAVFEELTDDTGKGESLLRQFASAFGDALTAIGNFLTNNADTIANFIGFIADGFLNTLVPAIITLGQYFLTNIFPKIVSFIRSTLIPFIQNLWETFNTQVLPWLVGFIQSELLPRFKEIRDYIMSDIVPAFQSLIDGLIDVGEEFEGIPFQKIIDFAENGLQDLIKSLTELIDETGEFLSENEELIADLIKVAAAIGTVLAAAKILAPAFSAIYSALVIVGPAIYSLGVLIAGLASSISSFAALGAVLKASLVGIGAGLYSLLGPIGIVIAAVALLAAAWATDFRGMRSPINNFLESIFEFGKVLVRFIGFLGKLVAAFFMLGDGSKTAQMLILGLKVTLKGIVLTVKGLFNIFAALFDLLTAIMLFIMGDWGKAEERLHSFRKALLKGMEQLVAGILAMVVGLAVTIVGTIIGFLIDLVVGIGLIAGRLNELWRKALMKMLTVAFKAFKKLAVIMWNLTKQAVKRVISFFQDLWEDIKRDAKKGFENIKSKLGNFIDGLVTWMKDKGEEIIDKFVEGIENGVGKVGGAMKKIVGEVGEYLNFSSPSDKGFFSDKGPSGIGEEDISGGLADGIEDGEGDIESSMESSMDDLPTEKEFDVGFDFGGSGTEPAEHPDIKSFEEDIKNGFDSESQFDMDSDALGGSDSPIGSSSGTGSGFGGPEKVVKKFIVDEKAVYFESGAFQGVSDEELPGMVEEEVDESLEDVMQEMDGAGRVFPR